MQTTAINWLELEYQVAWSSHSIKRVAPAESLEHAIVSSRWAHRQVVYEISKGKWLEAYIER